MHLRANRQSVACITRQRRSDGKKHRSLLALLFAAGDFNPPTILAVSTTHVTSSAPEPGCHETVWNAVLNDLLAILVLIFCGGFLLLFVLMSDRKCERVIQNWAKANGYEVLEKSYSIFGGPFWLKRAGSLPVYRIKVRNHDGVKRAGHVMIGKLWSGVLGSSESMRIVANWKDN